MNTQTATNVVRLPLPTHLDPQNSTRALKSSVRVYFEQLFNSSEAFRDYLASVGNRDSITKNRLFDRHNAILMIKASAKKAGDSFVEGADEGIVYKHVVSIMRDRGLGLRVRRAAYLQLTHMQAAE